MEQYTKTDMVEVEKLKKTNKEECVICCEFINKSNRKKVTCPMDECAVICCKECFKYHLMNSGINPTCMQCKKDLSIDFLRSNITQKAYKEYEDHTAKLQVELRKLELSQWQDRANAILRDKKFKEDYARRLVDLRVFDSEFFNLKNSLSDVYSNFSITKVDPFTKRANHFGFERWRQWLREVEVKCSLCDKNSDIIHMCECGLKKCKNCISFCFLLNDAKCVVCDRDEFSIDDIKEISSATFFNKFFKPKNRRQNKADMKDHRLRGIDLIKQKVGLNERFTGVAIDLYRLENGDTNASDGIKTEKKEREKFVKKCPNSDCKGFLTTAWKCGLCDDFFCSDCNGKKDGRNDESHVCDETEKATMEMLKKDTKPCPKCTTPIIRYTGCDHMFTPCCNTGFNWKTGEILANNRNTSPEYYEYLRRTNNGIVPRDVGDDTCGGRVDYYDVRRSLAGKKLRDECLEFHRIMEHVRLILLPDLPTTLDSIDHSELGVKYLTGEIDDDKWVFLLKKKIKKEKKENEIYHVLNMYLNVMDDLFRMLLHDKQTNKFINNVHHLIAYSNEQIEKINKNYKSVCSKYFIR